MINSAPKRPEVFFENVVFYISLFLLMMVVGAFFYIGYLMIQKNVELESAKAQLEIIKTENRGGLENKISTARQKLNDFAKIIASRRLALKFFQNFETLTLDEVYFSQCNLDLSKMVASLSGHGKNFQNVGQQIIKFRLAKNILSDVSLDKANTNTEEKFAIDFTAIITLDPRMVNLKQ